MLGRAGLAQCHTDRAWGPCWPCLGKGGTGSHTWVLGQWEEWGWRCSRAGRCAGIGQGLGGAA